MAENLFRIFRAQEVRSLSEEEVQVAMAAVQANIEKAKAFKELAMKFHDERRFNDAVEEEEMLRRLLAEYEILAGGEG